MNTEMTKAILDGRKVQTRRAITQELIKPIDSKFPENEMYLDSYNKTNKWYWWTQDGRQNLSQCIKANYQIGETIWVREPAYVQDLRINIDDIGSEAHIDCYYNADGARKVLQVPERFNENNHNKFPKWIKNRQGIPNGCIKEMARIFLKVTNVRVERLQDIEHEDILQEGFPLDYEIKNSTKIYYDDSDFDIDRTYEWWIDLWNSTAPKGYKWEDNPYVFVYEFEMLEK
jgi:hypothetical protein